MEKFGRSIACLVVLLLFLAPREVTSLRRCESQSQQFNGICTDDHNCGIVCRSEGFSDGLCRVRIGVPGRGCFCTKPC
ncbi:hypothetical protein ACS0TY_032274 [Phlomoides rotata]